MLETVSVVAAVLLGVVALVSRRPLWAAAAFIVSNLFSMPLIVLSTGVNSAVFASDVVLVAVLLRRLGGALRAYRAIGPPPGTGAMAILCVLAVTSRMTAFVSSADLRSFGQLGVFSARFVAFAATYLVLALQVYGVDDFRRLVRIVGLAIAAVGVANLLDRLGVIDVSFSSANLVLEQGGYRSAADEEVTQNAFLLGFNRASVGLFAYWGIMLQLLWLWTSRGWERVVPVLCLPLVALVLLDSFSRAAVLALVVAGLVLLATLRVKHRMSLIAVWACGAAVVVLTVSDRTVWIERFAALFSRSAFMESTGHGRVDSWIGLLKFVGANPGYALLGIGFLDYRLYAAYGADTYSAGHNMYVHTFGELGVAGLLAFCAFWLALLKTFLRWRRDWRFSGQMGVVGVTMLATYIGLLASGVSQESLYPNAQVYLVVAFQMAIIAAAIGLYRYSVVEALWLEQANRSAAGTAVSEGALRHGA